MIVNDLEYVIMNPRDPHDSSKQLRQAYELWREVWAQTFAELDGAKQIFSDDFTRQDWVTALFKGDMCLMISCFRQVDLSQRFARDDSYFRPWSDEYFAKLQTHGSHCLVGSNITLHPSARKDHFPVSVKDLCLGLGVKFFLSTGCEQMAGTMRADKGMHECAYRFGAKPIEHAVNFHNVPVDLVTFPKTLSHATTDPEVVGLIEKLWHQRCDLTALRDLTKAA